MKRQPIKHGGVFTEEPFAWEYARKHQKMGERFARIWGAKLRSSGFSRGNILDAGCGSGATNLTLANMYPDSHLVGIDLSEPLLAVARETARERGSSPRVSFEKADVLEIPFERDSFDVVLNANVAHLVEDPVRMLNEIERVLAPGGFLFIIDLRRSFLGVLEREIRSALSAGEARQLLARSQLREGRFSAGLLWWRFQSVPPSSG